MSHHTGYHNTQLLSPGIWTSTVTVLFFKVFNNQSMIFHRKASRRLLNGKRRNVKAIGTYTSRAAHAESGFFRGLNLSK